MIAVLDLQASLKEIFAREWLGNSLERWAEAAAILIVVFLGLGLVKRLVQARFASIAARTDTDLDDLLVDLVRRTKRFFLFVVAFYVAHHWIEWPRVDTNGDAIPDSTRYERYVENALKVAFWIQTGLWGLALVEFFLGRVVRGKGQEDRARVMGATVLRFIARIFVWTVILLSCLQAIGVNVNSLIAGLGVGGIAIALAAQNVLGDLFASIAILLDKPFVVGDSIVVGDFNGTVEQIGVKTTRLRSVDGEEIVMGNQDLVSSRIRNFKRLEHRRVITSIGITYDTPPAKVRALPQVLREIVEAEPEARFERAHFKAFGDSALQFELVYFALTAEYIAMMDLRQSINVAIHERLSQEGIEFAFPTQVVRYVPQGGAPPTQNDTQNDTQNELSLG